MVQFKKVKDGNGFHFVTVGEIKEEKILPEVKIKPIKKKIVKKVK